MAAGDWWSYLDQLSDEHEWARIRQYVEWIGSLSDKLGDPFGEFFEDPLTAQSFNEALAEEATRFESLFTGITKFERDFAGKLLRRKHGDGTVFVADFANHTRDEEGRPVPEGPLRQAMASPTQGRRRSAPSGRGFSGLQ
ncbi:MAG: hypothetical protein JW751_31400, partial [Polyangiaceae bacterium]|nr:hypothetical protein [Polyangiaceae bacterium]